MHCFPNLDALIRQLPQVAQEHKDWLCAHQESWLAHPETTPVYLFEPDDDPEWVEQVCGRLGLHAMLQVEWALRCLEDPREEVADALRSYVMLFWLA